MYFAWMTQAKAGKKEFLKSHIVPLIHQLTWIAGLTNPKDYVAHVSLAHGLKRTIYDFMNSFIPAFTYIIRDKNIFFLEIIFSEGIWNLHLTDVKVRY